jgi:hypothetical protein
MPATTPLIGQYVTRAWDTRRGKPVGRIVSNPDALERVFVTWDDATAQAEPLDELAPTSRRPPRTLDGDTNP